MSGSTGTAPGVLSPFDIGASQAGLASGELAMGHRYGQLGLGETGATPTSPGSFGTGSTPFQMDIGALPSLTGGIPAEFTAGLGEVQTNDLRNTLAAALSNLQTGSTNKGNLINTAGNLGGKL